MTLLTRNSLPDFDTMSLFQDLKLKRRKIDSRCSSDGKLEYYVEKLNDINRFFCILQKLVPDYEDV